jgi:dienelactone hydrolase
MRAMNKPLVGYESFEFSAHEITHAVYVRGGGPGVLLMHELRGMVPEWVELGTLIANSGFRVFLPLLSKREARF